MLEYKHQFETIDGQTVTLTLKNTLFHDIQFMEFEKTLVPDTLADADLRSNFCWILARVEHVDGIDWQPVKRGATLEEIEQCYHAFSHLVDGDTFYSCVGAVNKLKQRTDKIEKPDALLTKAEKADPN
jgi:hypothetical protein